MATTAVSRYLAHLPGVFQDDPFLGRFMLAFERVLTGVGDLAGAELANPPAAAAGIEEILNKIHTYFDPGVAPAEFLPWLATWVATSLREDWDEATRRSFLALVVPLYQRRGTKLALQQLLQIYLDPTTDPSTPGGDQIVQIIDDDPSFPPRYFQVRFTVSERDPHLLARRAAIATAIIDREKPAHTFYGLHINYPSLQIADPPIYVNNQPTNGVFVGLNTVLGGNVVTATA
jgi:phage tail-like protein